MMLNYLEALRTNACGPFLNVLTAASKDPAMMRYLDMQRAAHLRRMQQLTELKRTGSLVDVLLADHALFHLEADLRWIDLTSARLNELAEAVRNP